MARPRKGSELNASATIGLRVPLALRQALDTLAERNGRPITEEARAALEAHVAAAERADKRKGRAA